MITSMGYLLVLPETFYAHLAAMRGRERQRPAVISVVDQLAVTTFGPRMAEKGLVMDLQLYAENGLT